MSDIESMTKTNDDKDEHAHEGWNTPVEDDEQGRRERTMTTNKETDDDAAAQYAAAQYAAAPTQLRERTPRCSTARRT